MHEGLRKLRDRLGHDTSEEDNDPAAGFKGLRFVAAQLLLLAGVDVALDSLARDQARRAPPFPHGSAGPGTDAAGFAASWLPTLLAPVAAAAQVKHGLRPTPATASATRVLNAAVIGAGVAGLAATLMTSRRTGKFPSLTPLALASAGLLGLILEREEREAAAARRALERRASLIGKFVGGRGARVDRIVVHV